LSNREAEAKLGPWDVKKTTARMGYDYYEYQADRDRAKAAKAAEVPKAAEAKPKAAKDNSIPAELDAAFKGNDEKSTEVLTKNEEKMLGVDHTVTV